MDGGAARKIASLCVTNPGELVFEIGAGTGTLTEALARDGARVVAIEIDPDLVAILRERGDLGATEIVEADALAYDFEAAAGGAPWTAAGNLPYNIATPLILGWLEGGNPPGQVVVMVQKDVAERFMAQPGTPAYGSLSVAVQYAMRVRRALTLGPNSFYPRPKVDSSVVVLERRTEPAVACRNREFFFRIVRGAFAYRRKTLANSLSLALEIPRERVQTTLEALGLDREIRGERLDLAAFAALADQLLSS
jgi:16S rRNA (adenine1518-N6/adenine1519-N6)-dimethyltransferase